MRLFKEAWCCKARIPIITVLTEFNLRKCSLPLVRFPLGIQLDRGPRPHWIQYIALLVLAEVKNRVCTECFQCILGACFVSMRSFWLEPVEEHQIRVAEVVWASDAICSCSVLGFILAGMIWVFTSAGACQRAQSWVNHGAKRLLVSFSWKRLNDCRGFTGRRWEQGIR